MKFLVTFLEGFCEGCRSLPLRRITDKRPFSAAGWHGWGLASNHCRCQSSNWWRWSFSGWPAEVSIDQVLFWWRSGWIEKVSIDWLIRLDFDEGSVRKRTFAIVIVHVSVDQQEETTNLKEFAVSFWEILWKLYEKWAGNTKENLLSAIKAQKWTKLLLFDKI